MTAADERAVLLIGGLGVGKSALAREAFALLAERGEPAAVVDLDHLAWASPACESGVTVESLMAANLRAVLPAYRRAGVRRYVLVRAVESERQVETIRAALRLPLALVRVTAERATAERRIRARDVGAELEENLVGARRLDPPVEEDFDVTNEGRPIRDVAAELLERLGWARIDA